MPSDGDYAAMAYGRGNREPHVVSLVEKCVQEEAAASFAAPIAGPLSPESLNDKGYKAGQFLTEVGNEFIRAASKHAPMNSLHEGYAVLLEEVDELWEQVKLNQKKRDPANIRVELIQIAAMAVRTAVDLGYA